ncbi:MAG TPA: hypothetical protein VEW94_11045 [Chloroflexia bacterium]|nr:hypothetical protein [Chloroflexia bacterium]
MSKDASKEDNSGRRTPHAEHTVEQPGSNSDVDIESAPAYSEALLGNPSLDGRGNQPVKIALMQSSQGTYGNQAVQRFLQRARSTPQPGREAVQRQEPATATPTTTPTETPAAAPTEAPADDRTLSGSDWCAQFPTSTSVSDLEADFGGKVQKFIDALTAAGVPPTISATKRPADRAFLMHWSWRIVKENYDAQTIPARDGVKINWWHGDAAKSKKAAQDMVDTYQTGGGKQAPSLTSRHIEGKAIDMDTNWAGELKIKDATGKETTITSEPRTGANADLIKVGATYGVIHFTNAANDVPHWSTDGK